jgi:hypothetical protein
MPIYIIKLPNKDDDTIAKACNTLYNINKGAITYNLKSIQETIHAFEEYDSVFSYASYIYITSFEFKFKSSLWKELPLCLIETNTQKKDTEI